MQALESAVRKKKQVVLSEEELRQQRSRAQSPEKPSLLQRVLLTVRRGDSAQALELNVATLKEEVPVLHATAMRVGQSGNGSVVKPMQHLHL